MAGLEAADDAVLAHVGGCAGFGADCRAHDVAADRGGYGGSGGFGDGAGGGWWRGVVLDGLLLGYRWGELGWEGRQRLDELLLLYRVDDLLEANGGHVLAAGLAGSGVVAAQVGAVGREITSGSRGDGAFQVGVVGGDAGRQLGHVRSTSGQLSLEGPLGSSHRVGLAAEGLTGPQPPGHVLVAFAVFHGGRASCKDCQAELVAIHMPLHVHCTCSCISLTRPEAEQVLGAAGFDGAHGAVLDAHYGPFCAERHFGSCVSRAGG